MYVIILFDDSISQGETFPSMSNFTWELEEKVTLSKCTYNSSLLDDLYFFVQILEQLVVL